MGVSIYVLQRQDGKYVSVPGSEHSYTRKLENAQKFSRYVDAFNSRCELNERVVEISAR